MPGSTLANIDAAPESRVPRNLEAGLLDAVGHAVIATDLDGYIVYWNRAAERLYGWARAEVSGRNIVEVLATPNSRSRALEILERLQNGESWSGTFTARHKDGHWLTVHVTDSPVHDHQGNMIAIVGVSCEASRRDRRPRHLDHLSRAFAAVFDDPTQSLDSERRARFGQLIGALLLFAVAVAARMLLDAIAPERLPFITFFPVLVLGVFLCGFWPTVGLLLASAVTGAWWSGPSDASELPRVVFALLFMLVGATIIVPLSYALTLHRRLKMREGQLEVINGELAHRIKNLCAVMNSVCTQTIKSDVPRQELAKIITGRIKAIASAQNLSSVTAVEGADLATLVKAVAAPLSPSESRLLIEGPMVNLPKECITPLALILHELATNAIKHGSWRSSNRGCVSIQWRLPTTHLLELRWREQGCRMSATLARPGLGTALIHRALSQAKVRHEVTPEGVDCRIELRL